MSENKRVSQSGKYWIQMKMEYSLGLHAAHVLFMDEVWSAHISCSDPDVRCK